MNSLLQCLSNFTIPSQYFIGESFKTDLNQRSETRGEIAIEFSNVIKLLWSGRCSVRHNFSPPFHTGFELFLIVLGKSDENMPYWLGFGDSFAMLCIAVMYLVQELY